MRVLIVNTSERIGGAAIAANRLMEALKNNGVKAKMLVRDKETEQITVCALKKSWRNRFRFVWERVVIWKANGFKKHNLFQVDVANTGVDITSLPEFKEADIIHLHWVNQGFLSLKGIRKIIDSGKPVVWTLHDMWPFTGICHYSGDCDKYLTACHHCPMILNGGGQNDLSAQVFRQKEKLLRGAHITFVACSQWLEKLASQSALLTGQRVVSIPNAINTALFRPEDKAAARLSFNLPSDKILLLFSSMKITDKRKGIDFLVEACRHLAETQPQLAAKLGIVIVGKEAAAMKGMFPFPVYAVDYVADERRMVNLYNAVQAFVTPSLQDNLPNTIVESMACGTPCIGFEVGGIPEMIDHKVNGYIARYQDAQDLADGIVYVLQEADYDSLSRAAVKKAGLTYGESAVAMKYIKIYNQSTDRAKA